MKIPSRSANGLVAIALASAVTGLASPAHAVDFFVNNTGAPVTDFHFDELTTLLPRIPKSVPWGDGTAKNLGGGNYTVSYSGTPIPVGGMLKFNDGSFTPDTSHDFSNFVWTPGGQSVDMQHATGKVPEPSMWLMMLLGFGSVGFAFRMGGRQRPDLFDRDYALA
jgi:hypothetical protein